MTHPIPNRSPSKPKRAIHLFIFYKFIPSANGEIKHVFPRLPTELAGNEKRILGLLRKALLLLCRILCCTVQSSFPKVKITRLFVSLLLRRAASRGSRSLEDWWRHQCSVAQAYWAFAKKKKCVTSWTVRPNRKTWVCGKAICDVNTVNHEVHHSVEYAVS